MNLTLAIIFCIIISLAAFLLAGWLYLWIKKQDSSNPKIEKISDLIKSGANTFIRKEYTILAKFAGVVAILILIFLPRPIWNQPNFAAILSNNIAMVFSYLFGTIFSGLAGKIGIFVATIANKKTAEAATRGIAPSFLNGFRGGAVMGMAVVGSSLLGVAVFFWVTKNPTMLLGFSFGASSLALFAKAGGGIFTKTADISADLVGKVELGIPEDDPRNPAVIADNVGDNVGDVAGMGADLFDSHVASLAAAIVMAASIDTSTGSNNVAMVFVFAALGLLSSIIGVMFAKMGKNGNPTRALNLSTYITTGIFALLTLLATLIFKYEWRLYFVTIIGLLVGVIIGITTDYFTNDERKPVRKVAEASKSGPALTIISGMSYGFL
jgi:K(+)-stimulated pyrophosphate-energized sodium pump